MTTTTGAAETAHPSGDDRFEIVDKHLKRVHYSQDQLIETLHVAQDVHQIAILDAHTANVACQSCHIPVFAKGDPTDMMRDWSLQAYDEEKNKYGATITLESNVVPAYAWFDGRTIVQKMDEPVARNAEGKVVLCRGAQATEVQRNALERGRHLRLRALASVAPPTHQEER